MKIIKIFPWGWCEGVSYAYSKIKKIASLHNGQKIYMMGWLVHNQSIVEKIEKIGIVVIDSFKKNKLNLVKKIKNKKNSVIVFSAHGTDPEIVKYAKSKFYQVYDLTCKYVEENMEKVQRELLQNKTIIFLGIKKHPEAQAFKALSTKVKIVDGIINVKKILKFKKQNVYATTQSTILNYDAEKFREYLIENFKSPTYASGACLATKFRQENLIKNLNKIDVLVVVGDKKSNNTKSLVEIAIKRGIKVKWVSSWREIVLNEFKKIKRCGICSGASTPIEAVNEVYELLNQINN